MPNFQRSLFKIPKRISVWLLVCAACTACSVFPSRPLQDPLVSVHAIEVESASLAGIEAVLTLDVENPNSTRLLATGYEFQLEVAGSEFATGASDEGIRIPANATERIKVPVTLSYAALLEVVPRMLELQRFDYVTRGNVALGPKRIPFERSGLVRLPLAGKQ